MCAEIGGNNIPQKTSNTVIKSPEKSLDESLELAENISTNDSDDGAFLALIMNGPELDLLKDLDTIQTKMRVKYPSLKLFARGPWLLEKIIKSDATTNSK